jgi:hypothetical protein
MEIILNQTIGGVPVDTLVGMTIVLCVVVWLWSRWDERKTQKKRVRRAKYQAWLQDLKEAQIRDRVAEHARVRKKLDEYSQVDEVYCARAMEEARRALDEIRLPATSGRLKNEARSDLSE